MRLLICPFYKNILNWFGALEIVKRPGLVVNGEDWEVQVVVSSNPSARYWIDITSHLEASVWPILTRERPILDQLGPV